MPKWMKIIGCPCNLGADNEEMITENVLLSATSIGGYLHILNNMTLDMDKAVSGCERWLNSLQASVNSCPKPTHRQGFIAMCVRRSRFPEHEHKFKWDLPSIVH